ncbi:MAG: glycoside hydrolase family 28 protein [Pseudomonadota bacterium]
MTFLPLSRRLFLGASVAALGACASRSRVHSPQPDPWARAEAIAAGVQRPRIPQRRFTITDFGGAGGGDARPAIAAAFEAAEAAGGGRIVLPAGEWFCDGPVHFRSRCALHLEAGARLVFSGNPQSYLPVVFTRWEGTEVYNYSPLIYGRDLTDVAITGAGVIDGQGEKNFLPWRENQRPDQRALRRMGAEGAPVETRIFGEGHWLRPHFIQFLGCERVLVEDVTIADSPFWCVHPVYCRHVTVRGVTVMSKHINSDGVDPDSSEDVLIEKCAFDIGDDGVALKAGRDQDGWRVARKTCRVVVRDCTFVGVRGGGMAIGSEMSGGVEDVFVERYAMNKVHHGLYFKANLDRGGEIRNVYIRDIKIGEADTVLIFTNDYHSYRGGNFPTRFEDVLVENVQCRKAAVGMSIIGHVDAPVRRVTVRDMDVGAIETPLQINHVEDLVFERVMMGGEPVTAVLKTAPSTFQRPLKH